MSAQPGSTDSFGPERFDGPSNSAPDVDIGGAILAGHTRLRAARAVTLGGAQRHKIASRPRPTGEQHGARRLRTSGSAAARRNDGQPARFRADSGDRRRTRDRDRDRKARQPDTSETPKFPRIAFLAATDQEIALLKIRSGGFNGRLQEVIARLPRNDVASARVSGGLLRCGVTGTPTSLGASATRVSRSDRRHRDHTDRRRPDDGSAIH
jgi:hypothetical protein